MLINFSFGNMEFGKKVKLRIWISALLIVLGALAVGIVLLFEPFSVDYGRDTSFALGFYFGMGFGLIGAAIASIVRNVIYLKNAEKFKAAETIYNDERNRFIANKTWSVSAIVMLFLVYLALVVSGIFDLTVFRTLLAVLAAFGLVLLIVKTVLKKIY